MQNAKQTKTRKLIFICITILLAAGLLTLGWIFGIPAVKRAHRAYIAHHVDPLTEGDLAGVDFARAKKLMIVSHPDDEMLWGGAHLSEGGYLVVCITGGRNETRSLEFTRAVEATGNQGLILSYPDKVNGQRDDWEKVRDSIAADLTLLLGAADWELIVTHNERGEYGHQHHLMTHGLVVDCYEAESPAAKLYFFGNYHKAKEIAKYDAGQEEYPEDLRSKLSEEAIEHKLEIFKLYSSQEKTLEKFLHMVPYENWIPYEGSS